MKKNTGNGIKLGIFVTIGIVLLIVGIYFIGDQKKMFSNTIKLTGLFRDVNGLKVGNNVHFSGITIGTVENIEIISDTTVKVDIRIEEFTRKFIKKDATAVIGSEGLMGNKIMNISPGNNSEKTIEDGDFITTYSAVSIDDILLKIKVTVENAAVVSDELAQIMVKVNSGKGSIGMLLNDSTIAQDINKTIVNLKSSTKGLDENMEAAKHNILLKGYFKKRKRDAEKEKNGKNGKNGKK